MSASKDSVVGVDGMKQVYSAVAHALMRAASALVPTQGRARQNRCREESRHGTHECVRHEA